VTPARPVPDHIIKPSYMTEKNPQYGQYEGSPVVHNNQTVESKTFLLTQIL